MPLFLRQRDLNLFNTMTQDLVEDIIETPVYLYKKAISYMQQDDLYGDTVDMVYYNPVTIYALISHDPEAVENNEYGVDMNQMIIANMQRDIIRTADVYPEIGDILQWNNAYYEIHNVNENQLAAGQQDQNWNYAVQCHAHLSRKSKVQIEQFRGGGEI